MTYVAKVLYENQRNEAKQYPLHTLVCALVDDQLEKTSLRFALGLVDGVPRSGKNKLLRDCRERVHQMFAGLARERRFALIDGDQLGDELGHEGAATLDTVRQALAKQYPDVQMFTPDADHRRRSNTEAIVTAVASCLGIPLTDVRVRAALDKDMISRDRLFANAANGPRHVRDQLRGHQPSLAGLADTIADLLRSAA